MENVINKQHVLLPNDLIQGLDIKPKDLLVYLTIKRYMNKDTREAFPSIQTIANKCKAATNTIRESLKRLEESKYIEIKKCGRKNVYKFSPYKNFECFSYELLDNEELDFATKAYYVACQQFMKEKDTGVGVIKWDNQFLGDKIHLNSKTINKYDKILEKLEYLTIEPTVEVDEYGNNVTKKKYDLKKFGQAIVTVLMNHEERILENSEEVSTLKAQYENRFRQQDKRIEELENMLKSYQKQQDNKQEIEEILID